eukprot:GFYU01023204.1.p1 GENE.GFYU01023204.1~~GFYU01023204.1.p1  ORF type:complete len:176 (+),score=51.73 GFYU01023204.1:77-604(+)
MSVSTQHSIGSAPKAGDGSSNGQVDGQSVTKRLSSELMSLMMAQDAGISAFPQNDNLFEWIGTIKGSDGTVYEGQEYKLSLKFPQGYPYTAPVVKFETPCFHPNVDNNGFICLDILKEKWSAVYNVRTILLSIQSLLSDPNLDSPLNGYAAALWENQVDYEKVLRKKYAEHTEKN